MVSYRIIWRNSASKELYGLERKIICKIISKVEELAVEPFPYGIKKLKGTKHTYRLRIEQYRIIYSVISKVLVVEVIHVGHRKDIYKKFYRSKK